MRSSGGYYWSTGYGAWDRYIGRYGTGKNGTTGFMLYKNRNAPRTIHDENALHLDSRIPGYPTSNGCIHLGPSSSGKMYKKISKIVRTDYKTIKLIFY